MRPIQGSLACAAVLLIGIVTIVRAELPKYDLSRDKVLYCVGYAHLDTQWRWDFCTTINEYIRDTLDHNFQRIEQYPGYVFNFTGSVRYEMMKEYYPEKYEQLKKYIAADRWFVSGSSVDEGDVNVPSAEAIIRQVLYGNDHFRREFGKESVDFMLPDCFGFPASLPSIWAHCGLKGFSTQKLTWGSAMGIPFKIGVWEGPDGNSVIAALDPGPYVGAIESRVDTNAEWVARVNENGRKYGVWADYHYYGVGDQGGAPREEDVRNYVASIDNPDSQIKVALVSSDQMYKDITEEQRARLPRYKGDLLLTEHSAGTLTSQSYMKRWNRKNEILADSAERAATAAWWLGGGEYPREKLNRSWVRLLANQMHDILPGTSIPRAYTFSWNDEIVAGNGFAAVLTDAVGAIARALDTRVQGVPLVVYNPLAIAREDVVSATVRFPGGAPPAVRVFDPEGRPVPSQVVARGLSEITLLILASTPPVSWSVYDVRPASELDGKSTSLSISDDSLENEHYRVKIDANGDIASVIDKSAGDRELLSAPARLAFTREKPQEWPAWNMDWYDRQKPPIDFVGGLAKVRIVEHGPVRVALEIERQAHNSVVRQTIRLSGGDAGRRIEIAAEIDWQSAECALKATFPLTVSNPKATYNWGMGTIERGNNDPTKYEVPSHEWFDLTDAAGQYGVSILEDSKYGSDKPSDGEVRLTLLYTPGVRSGYLDQHSQDWGRHEMVYALYGHHGDWRAGRSEWQGRRLNQPLRAFQAEAHGGSLGRSWSFLAVNTEQVDVRAIKLAEDGSGVIIRVQELWGQGARDVAIKLPGVTRAEELDGQERMIGPATTIDGNLTFNLSPYQPRTFLVHLAAPQVKLSPPESQPLVLPFDTDVVSSDLRPSDGAFDVQGRTIPAEMLPMEVVSEGIRFVVGPAAAGEMNAVSCRGQSIELPTGGHNRLHILAAAEDDTSAWIGIGERNVGWSVQSWTGFIGQWDDRVWDRPFGEVDFVCEGNVVGIQEGFIKRDPIAWFCTHRHHPTRGNEAYRFSYLFKYDFPIDGNEGVLRLPDQPGIKVLAATLARNDNDAVTPAAPLYDDFTGRQPIEFRHVYPPPPTPVYEGLSPIAAVRWDRRESYAEFPFDRPSNTDFADQGSGGGIEFRGVDYDGELRPHARAGAVDGVLPRLNDGEVAETEDDVGRCVWWNGEGRFVTDLKRGVSIGNIATFSRHRGERAPQFFSLWGSNAETMPDPMFAHGGHGDWTFIALVNTRPLGRGGIHVSSVEPPAGQASIGTFRHLLWIAPQGRTFFTEVDVHEAR